MDKEKVLNEVIKCYGVLDKPYYGITYILPNGKFLDMRNCERHSDIEKHLEACGLSDYKNYLVNAGSPSMRDLGCIRCNMFKYYFMISVTTTKEQLVSLKEWIIELSKTKSSVELIIPNKVNEFYPINDIRFIEEMFEVIEIYLRK